MNWLANVVPNAIELEATTTAESVFASGTKRPDRGAISDSALSDQWFTDADATCADQRGSTIASVVETGWRLRNSCFWDM